MSLLCNHPLGFSATCERCAALVRWSPWRQHVNGCVTADPHEHKVLGRLSRSRHHRGST